MSKREAVLQLVRTRRFVGATAAVLGLAGGSAAGYFYAYKKLEKKFNEDLDGEIEATKRFFAQYTKTGEYSDPVTLAEKYNDETISEEGYSSNSEDPEEIVILEDEKLIEPINVVRKTYFTTVNTVWKMSSKSRLAMNLGLSKKKCSTRTWKSILKLL